VKINYDILAAMAPYFVLAVAIMGIMVVAIWAIRSDVRRCRDKEINESYLMRERVIVNRNNSVKITAKVNSSKLSGRGQRPLTPKPTILEDPINDDGRPRKRRKK